MNIVFKCRSFSEALAPARRD